MLNCLPTKQFFTFAYSCSKTQKKLFAWNIMSGCPELFFSGRLAKSGSPRQVERGNYGKTICYDASVSASLATKLEIPDSTSAG
jgi:hypothetical protein